MNKLFNDQSTTTNYIGQWLNRAMQLSEPRIPTSQNHPNRIFFRAPVHWLPRKRVHWCGTVRPYTSRIRSEPPCHQSTCRNPGFLSDVHLERGWIQVPWSLWDAVKSPTRDACECGFSWFQQASSAEGPTKSLKLPAVDFGVRQRAEFQRQASGGRSHKPTRLRVWVCLA